MRYVVAGCGAMGLPMARQLIQAGFETHGFDVRPLADYPSMASHMLADLDALTADTVLLLVVRDAQQIMDVCFDQQKVFRQRVYPQTLVVCSTVSPRVINELQGKLPQDVDLVDAPMSGAPYSAEQGSLTFMLGGADHVLGRLMPAFEAMGSAIHTMGPTGQGMLTKVMNNYVAASTVVAVRKSLQRAASHGLNSEKLLQVMQCSSGATWYGNNFDRIDWSRQSYAPDNTIGILEKDVLCSLDILQSSDEFDEALLQALQNLPDFN